MSFDRATANGRCQYVVHLSFRLFIWLMRSLGVLTYEFYGADKLRLDDRALIVANHPSLLDVVFIVSLTPRAFCVVKEAAWSNPVMAGVMRATGYIPNDDPVTFIEACVDCLAKGNVLVVFPEGTRTVPGKSMKLLRGAAAIIAMSGEPFTPVTITVRPTTLAKGQKWYNIPATRMHYTIVIGDRVDAAPLIGEGERLGDVTQRLNRILEEALLGANERRAGFG